MTETSWDKLLDLTYKHYPENWEEGKRACETLLRTPFLPPEIDHGARVNSSWYAEPIALLGNPRFIPPPYVNGEQITFPIAPGWSLFNPSIAANPAGEMRAIVRSANYTIARSGHYIIDEPDGIIRTQNYFVDPETNEFALIDDSLVAKDRADYLVQGLEDCRLFWHDGTWMFSATVRDRHPDGIAQMVVCWLDGHVITKFELLSDRTQHEKNWMPITAAYRPMWLYQCYPTMCRWDDGDGIWSPAPWIAKHFRGGTQVIPVDGRYLALVHESVTFDVIPHKVYTHRWVEFSPHFHITRVSPPFTFQGRGIEFAAGLVRQEDDLIVSYGVNDAAAWLLRMPITDVLATLEDAA